MTVFIEIINLFVLNLPLKIIINLPIEKSVNLIVLLIKHYPEKIINVFTNKVRLEGGLVVWYLFVICYCFCYLLLLQTYLL